MTVGKFVIFHFHILPRASYLYMQIGVIPSAVSSLSNNISSTLGVGS